MSIAKRELILARIFELLQTLTEFESAVRNRGLLDNDARPAVVLLDGNEVTKTIAQGRGRQRMVPVLVTMSPQVIIELKVKKPLNEGIGTELNSLRGVVVRAIASDQALLALIGANGDMSYDGAETDLKYDEDMLGRISLNFSLTTILDPYR